VKEVGDISIEVRRHKRRWSNVVIWLGYNPLDDGDRDDDDRDDDIDDGDAGDLDGTE
jgi:hypothetical protein